MQFDGIKTKKNKLAQNKKKVLRTRHIKTSLKTRKMPHHGPKVTISKILEYGSEKPNKRSGGKRFFTLSKIPVYFPKISINKKVVSKTIERHKNFVLSGIVLALTFFLGFAFAWQTENSSAVGQKVLSQTEEVAVSATGKAIPLMTLPEFASEPMHLSNSLLFTMPLDQLEGVFETQQKWLDQKSREEAEVMRGKKIKEYLNAKKSAFAEASYTIARQSHWKLILAIAFAESSWGRNCVDNNCSNIGVEPGHSLWREYKTYDDWVIDFNKLLERRYKDWTLEQMCGVYVKPCNQNWLYATRQVLEELKEKEIN